MFLTIPNVFVLTSDNDDHVHTTTTTAMTTSVSTHPSLRQVPAEAGAQGAWLSPRVKARPGVCRAFSNNKSEFSEEAKTITVKAPEALDVQN